MLAALFGVWLLIQSGGAPQLTGGATSPTAGTATSTTCAVADVVDGDTFTCQGGGEQRVRILGIDAPETGEGDQPRQCHARTATTALRRLVDGRTVTLRSDSRQPDRDRYGRRLAHVEVGGTDVAQALVRGGHATVTSFRTDQTTALREAQAAAQRDHAGQWRYC
ncbi:thermonuclease family protein [Barrientosiimonas humi]|uniref:thermonuclease family protein n=1 Tax=Barrientosiimonas humi TaxID=999931 RepID=UPI00370D7FAE